MPAIQDEIKRAFEAHFPPCDGMQAAELPILELWLN